MDPKSVILSVFLSLSVLGAALAQSQNETAIKNGLAFQCRLHGEDSLRVSWRTQAETVPLRFEVAFSAEGERFSVEAVAWGAGPRTRPQVYTSYLAHPGEGLLRLRAYTLEDTLAAERYQRIKERPGREPARPDCRLVRHGESLRLQVSGPGDSRRREVRVYDFRGHLHHQASFETEIELALPQKRVYLVYVTQAGQLLDRWLLQAGAQGRF